MGKQKTFDAAYDAMDQLGNIKLSANGDTLPPTPNRDAYGEIGSRHELRNQNDLENQPRKPAASFGPMVDCAPVMIWISDHNKHCTYFNKQWLEFTGRTLEQELGNGWSEGVYLEDLQDCLETYGKAFDAREKFKMSYRLRRYVGEYRWIFDSGNPQYNLDGTFTGYIGSCIDITEIKLAKKALHEVTGRVIQAQEQERKRIGRELHDDFSQRVALIGVELQLLAEKQKSLGSDFREPVINLQKKVESLSSDLHGLSYRLHPAKLDQLGLLPTVKGHIREMKKMYGFTVELAEESFPKPLPGNIAICLFRIMQEALWNAKKYSQVTHAVVELTGKSHKVSLKVCDSGVGFDKPSIQSTAGIGFVSMEERARLVGGTLSICSRPGEGTRVEVDVPLPPAIRQE